MRELDPLIHAPKRLRIMAILDAAQVEFSYLQERVGVSPPDLSKQMKQLVAGGYVKADKTGRGPGSTTWYRLTRSGRTAYRHYLDDLREIIGESENSGEPH